MTELVIGGAFLSVREHFVGFLGFLEVGFGLGVVGVAIRMVFHGQLAVGLFQLIVGRIAVDAERFVVVAL